MPKRLSVLSKPPALPIIYEQAQTDSSASIQSNPFCYDVPEGYPRFITPAPVGVIADWPLRGNATAPPTPWFAPPLPPPPPNKPLPPIPNQMRFPPRRPATRPAQRLERLPDRPQRRRDFSDIWTAWTRYQDKTESLSQRGNLQTFHDDLMQRPPGYSPKHNGVLGKQFWRRLWCFG